MAAGVWGCGTESSPVAPVAPSGALPTAGPLLSSSAALEAMERAVQQEYYALFTYGGVIMDFGDQRPFSAVVDAEQRHVDSIVGLFVKRQLSVPESIWNADNVPRFGTLSAACDEGVEIERAIVAMYQELLLLDLPTDVASVFESHLTASLEQHLPAFQRCASGSG
jgi:hypothetical protein